MMNRILFFALFSKEGGQPAGGGCFVPSATLFQKRVLFFLKKIKKFLKYPLTNNIIWCIILSTTKKQTK